MHTALPDLDEEQIGVPIVLEHNLMVTVVTPTYKPKLWRDSTPQQITTAPVAMVLDNTTTHSPCLSLQLD
jgi:hypothetical protein